MGSCDHSLLVEEFHCGSIDLGLPDVDKGLMEDFEEPFCGELESRLVEAGEACSGDCLLDEDCSDDFEKQFCSELMNDLDSDDATDFEAPAIELREDGLHNEASNLICLAQDEVSHTECGAKEACIHGGNVENEGLCLENKCFLDVSETSLNLWSVTGLQSNCNESDESKHMDSADSSNVGVRVAVAEEGKSKIFEESGCPEGAGEGCEMPTRLIRMNGGSADNPVEEGNHSIGINNSSAESLPGATETGMLPSSICRMSMEGSPTEGSLGNSCHYDAKNDENSVMYVSSERGLEVMHGNREVLHPQSNHVQQHDPEDINRVIGSAVPEVREVREDKDVVVGTESVTCTNGSHADRSSCNFKEGSQNVTFGDDAEISLLPDASPHVSNSSNGPSKRLDVPNNSLTGAIIAEPCSSITTGRFELKGDEDYEGNVCLDGSVTARTSEYIWQSLQRTTRSSTSRRASKKEVVSKKVRKTVAKGSTFHESIEIFSLVSKRKRSCLSKSRRRSSVWGSPGNILGLFEVNNQHVGRKLIKKGSHDPQNLRCERELRRNDNQEGRSLFGSKEKVQPVNGGIRLRIKIGKQGVSSVMMLTSEPETTSATDHEATGKNRQDALIDISGEEVPISRPFQCIKKQAENLELQPDASYLDVHRYHKRLENTINLCKSPKNEAGEIEVEVADGTENKHIDPGTSPDSEVINQSPDASVGVRVQESLHGAPMTSSSDLASTGDINQSNLPWMNSKKGRKKDKTGISNCADLAASTSSGQSNKRGSKKEMADGFNSHETSENIEKPPPSSKMKGHIPTKSFKSRENGTSKSDNLDVMGSRRENVHVHEDVDKLNDEKEVTEGFSCKVESNPEIGILGIDDSGRTIASDKSGSEEKSYMDMVQTGELESSLPPRNAWVSCDECQKWRRIPATLADSIEETNSKWTCIDNMDKAFANCSTPQEKSNSEINAELDISDAEDAADGGVTNSKGLERRQAAASQPSSWTLIKSNLFKHRRRKTQAIDEIMVCYCKPRANGRPGCGDACLNRVLNIECIRGTCPCGDSCSNQQFQKKGYAKLKCFRCGKKGYGLQLLEDISKGQFLIEYVGEVLDLHAYEARQLEYASRGHTHFYFMTLSNTEVIDACAKGNLGRFINHSCDPNCRTEKWMVNGEICIGLFAIREIKKGEELTFDYNYVRVFGAAAKKCVCGSSQCRGYIGGDPSSTEVIVQGDSDDEYPEPVMVLENGEKINSLDSLADKANSYIQEDTQTGEASKGRNSIDEAAAAVGQLEITRENEECAQRSASAAHFKSSSENVTPIETVPSSIQLVEHPIETEEATSKPIPVARQNIIDNEDINQSLCPSELEDPMASVPEKLISDSHDDGKISQSDKVEGNSVSSKSQPMIKKSKSSRSAKKEKHKTNLVTANKSQLTPNKTKKAIERTVTGRYEAVEEKLNELLDADGGISKQKDASKGYLKLLLLTAASGDSVSGEAIQSNRELSLLLEVLLKTKSRVVLVDIINKNGLRMLHNIMKQSRKEYTKTPILRKLLKVLEYLATKGILTSEHINVGPPCPGMESFRKSILTLTEHSNKQVHQIARNFRDRWLRQPLRKNECRKRDDDRNCSNGNRHGTSHRQDHSVRATEASDIEVGTKLPFAASSSCGTHEEGSVRNVGDGLTSGTKTRKRKSRWDEPAPTSTDLVSLPYKEPKLEPIESIVQPDLVIVVQKDECVTNHIRQEASSRENDGGVQPMHEDAPPGFCFPPDSQLVSPSISSDLPELSIGHAICTFEMVTGHPQERFRSCLPVSYGIPLSLLQKNGTPETANVDGWTNAPGVAFHPFPPLPSYPPNDRNPLSCSVKYLTKNEVGDVQRARCGSATYHTDQSSQSTSSAGQAGADFAGTGNQYGFGRARMNSIDLGKRFRQKKWNGNNFSPPWPKRRSKWDQMGNNPRNGMCNIDMESVQNEPKDPYISEDMGRRVQQSGINFYQQHRQNH